MSNRAGWVVTAGLAFWAIGVQITEVIAIIGVVLTALGLGASIATGARPISLREALRQNAVVLAFVGWGLLGPGLGGHLPSGTGAARLIDFLWLPLAQVGLLSIDERQRGWVAKIAGVTLIVSCLAAAAQHFGFWPGVETFAPLRFTRIGFERVYEPAPNDPGRFMAGGLAFHRLRFANVTLLVAVFLSAVPWRAACRWAGRATGVFGVVSVVLFPLARAAAAAGVVGLAASWVLPSKRRGVAVVAALGLGLAMAGLVMLSPGLRTRLSNSLNNEGNGERSGLMAAGLRAISEHPLVGVGAGRFRPSLFSPPDAPKQVLEHPGKAHDQFVSNSAELGLIGGALFIALLLVEAWRFFKAGRSGGAGLAVLITFTLLCLLHDPLFHAETSLALMLVLGASRVVAKKAATET